MPKNIQSNAVSTEFDADKTRALRQFMEKKGLKIEPELTDFLQKLYEKYVPAQVREFIEIAAD